MLSGMSYLNYGNMRNRIFKSSIHWIVKYCIQFVIAYILSVVLNNIFALTSINYRVPLSLVVIVSLWSVFVSYCYKRKKEKQEKINKAEKKN